MSDQINKIEWLLEHGKTHQFGRNTRVVVDDNSNHTTINVSENLKMVSRSRTTKQKVTK